MQKVIKIDAEYNQIIYSVNETPSGWSHQIFLKLKQKPKRLLADIHKYNGKMYLVITRERMKHLFRQNESYGFNNTMLKSCLCVNIDTIILRDDYGVYMFPISVIFDKGEFMYFKQDGFERQVFLKLDEINKYKIDPLKYGFNVFSEAFRQN